MANSSPAVITSENSLTLQENKLKNLLGLPLSREIEIQGQLLPEFIEVRTLNESLVDPHLRRNDYRNLELTNDLYTSSIRIQKAAWYPDLSFASDYQFVANADDFNFGPQNKSTSLNASFKLSLNLFWFNKLL